MSGEACTITTDACTIDVSASQKTNGTGPGGSDPHGPQTARYWGANLEGSKVFFTSTAELTNNAYTGPKDNAENLYEYELSHEAGKPGRLTDLTADGVGNGAAVLGVAQISEEGAYVYFVAEGALAPAAVAGAPNLYVSHEGGAPQLIATLAANDTSDWHAAYEEDGSGPAVNSAVVTPSGSRLAFISEQSLTGYDNEQDQPGECEGVGGRCPEVYLYDAETSGLVCASCNPSGARPIGPSALSTLSAARVVYAQYRPRNLTEDGTLFFDSRDALVPHASDGRQNVYEYEDGRIHAISDVAGGFESFFLDASINGDNVFFGSADQLLPEDTSNNVAVWDARVNGGFPVTVAPAACDNADSCKPPPTPQPAAFGEPSTATFSGPGNLAPTVVATVAPKKTAAQVKAEKLAAALKACSRDRSRKKRAACEKTARKRYGTAKSKAKKASNHRRPSR